MTLEEFKASLANATPPASLSRPLQVLWYAAKGDWDTAHDLTQDSDDRDVAWVHAYLHREEGDIPNAHYWYRRAGRAMPDQSLSEEWASIVEALL